MQAYFSARSSQMSPARIASADKRDLRWKRELNERKAFDRRRGFIFIGMIFRLHLPFASPSIIFSRISLVSSEFSYIRLILSFYSIERNISFRDTKRNNLFSYLSTLRTSSNEMRTKMGRGNFSLAFATTRPE